jgi:hypothetical protein
MIVHYSASSGLTLLEPDDFRNFKLLLGGAREDHSPSIEGITFVDERNALVPIDSSRPYPAGPTAKAGKRAIAP